MEGECVRETVGFGEERSSDKEGKTKGEEVERSGEQCGGEL